MTALLALHSMPAVAVHAQPQLDDDCATATPTPYTGYSLKTGTSCGQYVYCQDGIVKSWLTCPFGLLFDGDVGKGGICTWAANVECADDAAPESMTAMTFEFEPMTTMNAASSSSSSSS
eukprot:CAMPEP_0196157084 /NCGR_PEP_ID=MMETSP0910-20130528/43379_1 /TAXON_ID=49265 /ORGANISM="Thalassiosira rotula, Strain GSO102" /LENGTH=118 /DNA_ID=CAMNT_0041421669 /DNA_START=299 /DNA_END=651 /DNA_ORIENTATION=-